MFTKLCNNFVYLFAKSEIVIGQFCKSGVKGGLFSKREESAFPVIMNRLWSVVSSPLLSWCCLHFCGWHFRMNEWQPLLHTHINHFTLFQHYFDLSVSLLFLSCICFVTEGTCTCNSSSVLWQFISSNSLLCLHPI